MLRTVLIIILFHGFNCIEADNSIPPNKLSNICDTVNLCHSSDKLDHSRESYVKIEKLEQLISGYVLWRIFIILI